LTDLEGEFFVVAPDKSGFNRVDNVTQAQGVWFLCPKCFAENGGNVGTHSVLIPFENRGVPAEFCPGLPRWTLASGKGLTDLTVTPSILVGLPCGWHGFITNGDVA
jgi:hypothetical protein